MNSIETQAQLARLILKKRRKGLMGSWSKRKKKYAPNELH